MAGSGLNVELPGSEWRLMCGFLGQIKLALTTWEKEPHTPKVFHPKISSDGKPELTRSPVAVVFVAYGIIFFGIKRHRRRNKGKYVNLDTALGLLKMPNLSNFPSSNLRQTSLPVSWPSTVSPFPSGTATNSLPRSTKIQSLKFNYLRLTTPGKVEIPSYIRTGVSCETFFNTVTHKPPREG